MNRDDITRMAQEAGLEDGWSGWCQECGCDSEKLTRFAALIAAHEREQCVQLTLAADDQGSVNQRLMKKRIVKAIKARSIK